MVSPSAFLSHLSLHFSLRFTACPFPSPSYYPPKTRDCARASLSYTDKRHGLKVDHVASLYKALLEPCVAGAHAHQVCSRVFLRWRRSEVRSGTNTPRLHFNPHSSSTDLLLLAVKYRHRPGGRLRPRPFKLYSKADRQAGARTPVKVFEIVKYCGVKAHPSICLSVQPSVRLSIRLSVRPSIQPSIHPSVRLRTFT